MARDKEMVAAFEDEPFEKALLRPEATASSNGLDSTKLMSSMVLPSPISSHKKPPVEMGGRPSTIVSSDMSSPHVGL